MLSRVKSRKCKAPGCTHSFVPFASDPLRSWCSIECGVKLAEWKLGRVKMREALNDRKAHKAALDAAKQPKDLLKPAEKAVNSYVRERDRFDGCISCDKPSHWDGVWHASHFKSVGANSVLRFNTWNIHKSCSQCNFFKAGNINEYRKRVTLKIGAARVEWLDNADRLRRYESDYLRRLTTIFNKKTRRLKKRHEMSYQEAA